MTREETAKVLAYIAAVYPRVEIAEGTLDAWHDLLSDLPFELAMSATKRVLLDQDGPWLPAVGQIRRAALFLANSRLLDPDEAWGEVERAVRKFGWPRPTEALASMSPLTRRIVENIGWQEICASQNPDTVRGQFRAMYQAASDGWRREGILPTRLQAGSRSVTSSDEPDMLSLPEILQLLSGPASGSGKSRGDKQGPN
jgi:hypothetical protein